MAMPPKKKYKTKPSKVQQAAADQAAMKKIINLSIVLLLLPLVIFGVKQVNPGIFYIAQGMTMEKFKSERGAARAFESAYKANPEQNVKGLVNAARIYEYLEDWEAVDEICRRILDEKAATEEEKGAAQLHLAWRAYAQQRYEDSLVLSEAAQKKTKGDYQYRAWVCIGASQTKLFAGDNDKLLQAYNSLDTAIKLKRLFAPEAHYYMGLLYLGWKNQTADALDEFDYGLSQQPSPKLREKLLSAKSAVNTR